MDALLFQESCSFISNNRIFFSNASRGPNDVGDGMVTKAIAPKVFLNIKWKNVAGVIAWVNNEMGFTCNIWQKMDSKSEICLFH